MRLSLLFRAFVALLFTGISFCGYAGKEKFSAESPESVTIIDASQIGSQLLVTDSRFNNDNYDKEKAIYSCRVMLHLGDRIDNEVGNYSAEIDVNVTFTLEGGGEVVESATLSVNYSAEANYKALDVASFDVKCSSMTVEITGINESASSNPNMFQPELTAEINVERYYDFETTNIVAQVAPNYNTELKYLDVDWIGLSNAEEYDLEWTWIDNTNADGSSQPIENITLTKDVFRNNATRITTKRTNYQIPAVYERGVILYRIRAVGTHNNTPGLYKYGEWNYEVGEGVSLSGCTQCEEIETGHGEGINWQYSVVYAEEGKSKNAITYFDGSLRNRQAQTKLNTSKEAVVTEVIYDELGRPAVQVMPAPTSQAKIDFNPTFTKNTNSTPYTFRDMAPSDVEGSCAPVAGAMSNSGGAAKYYSSANDSVDFGHHKYIPSANSYPFSQTVYTNDKTGRITKQGGVGDNFQIGSGKEITYLYETPTIEDLIELFGSEVGIREHYKKQTVVDANGQASITYMDMQGNTIATTLAGQAPGSMESLDAGSASVVKTTYIDENTEQTIVSTQKIFTATKATTELDVFSISYALNTEQYSFACDTDPTMSETFNCVVDVIFRITDDCGEDYFYSATDGFIQTIDPNDASIPELSKVWLIGGEVVGENTSELFAKKTYTITKILKVNEAALEAYMESYFSNPDNTCLVSFPKFLEEESENLDGGACILDCSDCMSLYYKPNGDVVDEGFNAFLEEHTCGDNCDDAYYNFAKEQCDSYCGNTATDCDMKLQLMLSDVSPLGQYAKYGTFETDEVENEFPLSVLGVSKLPKAILNGFEDETWRHPMHFNKSGDAANYYYDENGARATVTVFWDRELRKSQPITSRDEDWLASNEPSGLKVVYPTELVNTEDFVAAWPVNNSWAYSLVEYHPEFAQYLACLDFDESNMFDYDLMSMTYEGLNTKYPGLVDNIMSVDPLFANGGLLPNNMYANLLSMKLANYSTLNETPYNLKSIAVMLVECPEYNGEQGACYSGCTINPGMNNLLSYLRDKAREENPDEVRQQAELIWTNYKMMYFSLKQKLLNSYLTKRSIQDNAYNGCIGDENFQMSDDRFSQHNNLLLNDGSSSLDEYFWRRENLVQARFNAWRSGFVRGAFPFSRGGNLGNVPIFAPWLFTFSYFTNESFHHAQPCNLRTYQLYEEKSPIFMNDKNAGLSDAYESGICYTEPAFPNGSNPEIITEMPDDVTLDNCEEQGELMLQEFEKKSTVAMLENCGQCPITLEMSNFLDGVVANLHEGNGNGLSQGDDILLSCYPQGIAQYTASIRDEMNISQDDYDNFENRFKVTSVADNQLDAGVYIGTRTTPACTLSLWKAELYPFILDGETITSSIDWTDIVKICCMEYLETPYEETIMPLDVINSWPGKRFRITAWVKDLETTKTLDGEIINITIPGERQVILEGFTNQVILNSCDVLVCETDRAVAEIGTFINNLSTPLPIGEDNVVVNLTETVTFGPSQPSNGHLYNSLPQTIINSDLFAEQTDNDIWTCSGEFEANGYFTITLTLNKDGVNNDGQVLFQLYMDGHHSVDSYEMLRNMQYYSESEIMPSPQGVEQPANPNSTALYLGLGQFSSEAAPERVHVYLSSPNYQLHSCSEYGYTGTPVE